METLTMYFFIVFKLQPTSHFIYTLKNAGHRKLQLESWLECVIGPYHPNLGPSVLSPNLFLDRSQGTAVDLEDYLLLSNPAQPLHSSSNTLLQMYLFLDIRQVATWDRAFSVMAPEL